MARHSPSEQYTVEEYLSHEAVSGTKYEYIDGHIYAMTGGSERHSLIAANAIITLGSGLRSTPCRIYTSDMRIQINDSTYVYPDFSVVCGDARFADDNRTMLTNPMLVAEVMSPSSTDYDRGTKGDFYRSLTSVQIYLLLDQSRAFAQMYTRQDAGWLLQEFEGRDAQLPLEALDLTLSLTDLYQDIVFDT